MADSNFNHIRQQHLKRALSIIVRGSEFEAATACSLDVLCNVSILYMQSMFAQVHAYAEHATRTRPNLNDVGRALEERNVSVAQIDAYYHSEAEIRLEPPINAAVDMLRRRADLLASGTPTAACVVGESKLFFDSKAEDLLRRLVASHKSTVEEQRRKEQAIQRAEMAAIKQASMRLESAMTLLDSTTADMRLADAGADTGIANAGSRVRRHSSDMMGDEDDEDDDDDDDDDDEDDEGEEDADFEAPATSTLLTHPSISVEDTDVPPMPLAVEDSDRSRQSGDVHPPAEPEPGHEDKIKSAEQPVDDMERLLLPSLVLPEHIPTQCPPFPSPHTYKQTPVLPEREQDFFRNRVHKAEQSRQAEENLQRLINGPRRDHSKSPTNSDDDVHALAVAADGAQSKHVARKRLEKLFPPANFRSTYKRTRLAGYIK
ncbi:transcription initiation factor TFIID subunit 8 [Coemansia sp. BCRC 34301]|nr:transcription initiation factor TFIID subunit 8 [Coemansia sp. BCRC 34301]